MLAFAHGPHRILALARFVSWPSAGAALAPGCVAASDRWSEVPRKPALFALARCSVGSGRLPGGESEPTSKNALKQAERARTNVRGDNGELQGAACPGPLPDLLLRRDAFCENRLFFKSITTATACLAGRLWEGYRAVLRFSQHLADCIAHFAMRKNAKTRGTWLSVVTEQISYLPLFLSLPAWLCRSWSNTAHQVQGRLLSLSQKRFCNRYCRQQMRVDHQ